MTSTEQSEDRLITAFEAAMILKKSPRTVQRMSDRGILPVAQKLPGATGAYLYHLADVEALVKVS